jgi:hypothetical protein
MPLSSQFQLSLELTNLIPSIPSGARELVNFARELQRSGSDLVAEEDLVEIFGRNKLEERFESSFKNVVKDSSKQTIISQALNIIIEGGAGPTVQRALKHREHFATIVQLSMLTWVHERQALASALITAMRRRVHEAPTQVNIRSTPGETALLGFLKSCQEQTGAFPWQRWFDGIRLKLGIPDKEGSEVLDSLLPVPVLQGSLDMLTAVQSFPEDRVVFIQGYSGVVTMVVWAYCLLGLTVSVEMKSGTISFGDGNAKVIIDATDEWCESTICLFDASHQLVLEIGKDDEFEDIDPEIKHLAKGYGTRILKRKRTDMELVSKMAHYSSAIAWGLARRLQIVDSPAMTLAPSRIQALESLQPSQCPPPEPNSSSGRFSTLKRDEPLVADEVNLLAAEGFLFDGVVIDRDLVRTYSVKVAKGETADSLSSALVAEEFPGIESHLFLHLALVMLALTSISDLSACELWRLGELGTVQNARITKYVDQYWMDDVPIPLKHDDWYQLLASMMLGMRCWSLPETITHTSLVSNWGWSMWMSSFSRDHDPFAITPGILIVRQGVPSCNGERRNAVMDGPVQGPSGISTRPHEGDGEQITWRCTIDAEFKHPLISVREDHFVVSVRSVVEGRPFCRGYRELHRIRWNAWTVPACNHDCNTPVVLSAEVATVKELGMLEMRTFQDPRTLRVYILLVRGNPAARWFAMAGGLTLGRNIVLAGHQNCLPCILDSVCGGDGESIWFVVS